MLLVRAEIREKMTKDANLSKIVGILEIGKSLKKLGLQNHEFALKDGILLKRNRVVILN